MRYAASLMLLSLIISATGAAPDSPFTTVDLRGVVNMGWRDEVAGDGKGGWTDQGDNDMRQVNPGKQQLLGIPFDLIDPATNGGRSVLVMKSTHFPGGPERAVIEVGAKAKTLYFLHATAWPDAGVAKYIVHYDDGESATLNVWSGLRLENWWTPKDGGKYRVALRVANPQCPDVGMFATGWEHPSPEKPIKSLKFVSLCQGPIPIIAAVTLSDRPDRLLKASTRSEVPSSRSA